LFAVTADNGGRRERRKAQTRAAVRETAQRLFAERGFDAVTIADVAAAADVAVQTVFNHFETKEALFFDGRTPWVERSVAAVTERAPGTDPVRALRDYLEVDLVEVLEQEARPENRGFVEALHISTSLRARERTLVEQTGDRVAAALTAAIANGEWAAAPVTDLVTARVLSRLVADLFLVAGRALALENRRMVLSAERDERGPIAARETAATTLAEVERCVRALAGRLIDPAG
jgi:AcrR family transcriptional regulator